MIRALFISDIHISSPQDAKYALFLRVLERCEQIQPMHLFLVGDIFDLWILNRHYFIERYAEAAERLRTLCKLGVKVHYFEGNHDLDLKLYWQHEVGVDVQEEAAFFEIEGRVFRVEHGDQMDLTDQGYLFLRWLLRTPFLKFLCRYLPNKIVAWIGERASRASRDYTSHVKTTTEDRARSLIVDHSRRVFSQKEFQVLVCGHVHTIEDREVVIDEKKVRLINLGTWLKDPRMAVFADSENGYQINLQSVHEWLA